MAELSVVGSDASEPAAVPCFDDFWLLYPRRVARKDAVKAWARLSDEQQVDALIACVAWMYVWKQKDPEYLPHGSTWLNGWRWEDELPFGYAPIKRAEAEPGKPFVKGVMPDHVRAMLAKLRSKP